MNRKHIYPIAQALLAAVLFGASAPLAKYLLGEIAPIPLAAFLYLGSGIGLLGIRMVHNHVQRTSQREARVTKTDMLWLAGAILAGGVAAPITLLISLNKTPAATASLLLNFEGVATTLLAALVFKEAIGKKAWRAIGLITLSSILLSVNLNANWGISISAVGIIAACFLWGLDNNLTRNISAKDPFTIVTIKGLAAGSFSLLLAMILGNKLPGMVVIIKAMLLGCLSYGFSIVLFIHALRGLGAARTSALFGVAPLAGMLLSFLIFREHPTWMFLFALPMMVLGTLLLVNEQHEHSHIHEMVFHEHAHIHDDGHHSHDHETIEGNSHSHPHKHEELNHEHDHLPDLHHRHIHKTE